MLLAVNLEDVYCGSLEVAVEKRLISTSRVSARSWRMLLLKKDWLAKLSMYT